MDHMLELARHRDVPEALRLIIEDPDQPTDAGARELVTHAGKLLKMEFLATEHPNAWAIEAVHAFYESPVLAANVWVKLRFCRTFRKELADIQLREEAAKKRWWQSPGSWRDTAGSRSGTGAQPPDRETKVREYASRLDAEPSMVKQICQETKAFPEPPAFIGDLLVAERDEWTPEARDTRIRELISQPAEARRIARGKEIPIPFSFVQEDELDQICITRGRVRPAPPGKSGTQSVQAERLAEPVERRSDAPLSYQGAPDEERIRRRQREKRRKRLDDTELKATTEVQEHKKGEYPRYSARLAMDMNLFGLAFSGGGIRSATFNLGVLQGLSRIGLLRHVDYLSTVSGGGYIGSWLAAWIRRELDDAPMAAGDAAGGEVMTEIQRRLSPARSPNPIDERLRPIRFLREYSNYLTPRTGFFSADTWTAIGIYVRNTLLNQIIIAAVFATILLLPRNWFPLVEYLHSTDWVPALRLLLWLAAAAFLLLNLRQLDPRESSAIAAAARDPGGAPTPPWYAKPWVIHAGVVLPWLLLAALYAQPLGEWAITGDTAQDRSSVGVAIVAAGTLAILLALGRADRCWAAGRNLWRRLALAVPAIAASALVGGAIAGGIWWLFINLLPGRLTPGSTELAWHLNALGTPTLMAALSLAIVGMLGVLGENFPDEQREWWSRLRTIVHVYAIGWLVWFLAAIYVPWAVHILAARGFGFKWGLSALATWVGSTLLGIRRGPKAETEQKEEAELKISPSVWTLALRWAVFAAPYVFVVGIVLGVSLAIDALYAWNADAAVTTAMRQTPVTDYWPFARWTTTTCHRWTAICAAVALVFSWRVDVNEFSIHHFYKNRLVRCYLGASHSRDRKPNWFTGFDPKDDLPLVRFGAASGSTAGYSGPYPILNCALNLVGGKDLAWQERKATSFVFTPKYCGYDVDRSVLTKDCRQHSEGFVGTLGYYNAAGPLLGMAMAISGAAANPNMGRASSPALGFLMTVFNVRLGWWIGNPRHRKGRKRRSPRLGLIYTLAELFGMTDDNRRFVNLSDGGHFDNLGVYELIRRNCRYIVVCDAGQDDRFVCEDLGALVRRCRVDFGVEIDIAVDRIRQRDAAGTSQAHCVVGRIKYLNIPQRVDEKLVGEDGKDLEPGSRPAPEMGYLVYIKPTMTGDEPQDVLEYARRVTRFPHQSTADQWFAESQFESYRALGMHIGEQTFARYQADDTHPVDSLDDLFEHLYRYWYPPSVAINERSTEHAAEYSRIMELVRSTTGLQGLDEALFNRLMSNAEPVLSPRDEFFVCNALIQLMENVYADLDLETNWHHPHVMGWMEVFRFWVRQPPFERTWASSKDTYAERFRFFYDDRLLGKNG